MKIVLEVSVPDASVGFAVRSAKSKSAAEESIRRIVESYVQQMSGYIVARGNSVVFSEHDVPGHDMNPFEYDDVSCEFNVRAMCRVQ